MPSFQGMGVKAQLEKNDKIKELRMVE